MLKSFLLIFLLSSSCMAQRTRSTACKLTISSAPTVRTLRLGQTFKDLSQKYTSFATIKNNWYGQSEVELDVEHADPKLAEFENLNVIYLKFLDGTLYKTEFGYHDPDIWWSNVRDFARQVSRMLKLPNAWVSGERPNNDATMDCGAVRIEATVWNGQPSLALTDLTLLRRYEARLRSGEKQRRDSFRP